MSALEVLAIISGDTDAYIAKIIIMRSRKGLNKNTSFQRTQREKRQLFLAEQKGSVFPPLP